MRSGLCRKLIPQRLRDYLARLEDNWVRQSKEPFTEFDEFWLIGYQYVNNRPDNL